MSLQEYIFLWADISTHWTKHNTFQLYIQSKSTNIFYELSPFIWFFKSVFVSFMRACDSDEQLCDILPSKWGRKNSSKKQFEHVCLFCAFSTHECSCNDVMSTTSPDNKWVSKSSIVERLGTYG